MNVQNVHDVYGCPPSNHIHSYTNVYGVKANNPSHLGGKNAFFYTLKYYRPVK